MDVVKVVLCLLIPIYMAGCTSQDVVYSDYRDSLESICFNNIYYYKYSRYLNMPVVDGDGNAFPCGNNTADDSGKPHDEERQDYSMFAG